MCCCAGTTVRAAATAAALPLILPCRCCKSRTLYCTPCPATRSTTRTDKYTKMSTTAGVVASVVARMCDICDTAARCRRGGSATQRPRLVLRLVTRCQCLMVALLLRDGIHGLRPRSRPRILHRAPAMRSVSRYRTILVAPYLGSSAMSSSAAAAMAVATTVGRVHRESRRIRSEITTANTRRSRRSTRSRSRRRCTQRSLEHWARVQAAL